MRKKERQIDDINQVYALLHRAQVLRLAMCGDDGWPYVVPVNFGVAKDALFVHGSQKGKKFEMLVKNNKVCFEVDLDTGLRPAELPCKWGAHFQSVVGYATAELLEGEQKTSGLNQIMKKYSGREFEYSPEVLAVTAVFKLNIESMTGKRCVPVLET